MAEIIVTGASGFIGSHLLPALQRAHTVIPLKRAHGDIADPATWANLPGSDLVVHLAANNFVPDSWEDPPGYIRSNLDGTVLALEYCRRHDARMIYVSSYLYGEPVALPIDETHPLSAPNPYALSKMLAEEGCRFYATQFNIPTTILRPFNIYGPGQNADFLIPSIVRQVLDGSNVSVQDTEPKRDFVHVVDFICAIEAAIERPEALECYNIGSGVSFSVSQLIEIIAQAAERTVTITSMNRRRANEIMDVRADISKAKQRLGWEPTRTLSEGCASVVESERARRQRSRSDA